MTQSTRNYRDLHEHLQVLEKRGLLRTIDRPIDKDSELHPLVRWQFVGGLDEENRKAFLFTNITDGLGRKYDIPVVVGAIAANPQIYSVGMDAEVADIQAKWDKAIANPIEPRLVNEAVCHEVVIEGEALQGEGHGLDRLPIPVSTPGFDSAPTLTATNVITRDPETGIQNMGTYRAALKAPDRLVVRMATRVGGAGGYQHYLKYQKRGEPMPCAIVLGCPPYVAFMGPQKLPIGVDEFTVAGGLAGEPINVVRARSVDLLVPAESELVIEGLIDTVWLEPEAPFGESHGHVALEEFNMPMQVTAITHRKKPIIPSYISQVAPSESSVIKRVAYEPLFLSHLRNTLGIRGVKRVSLHEPLTGLLRVIVVTVEKGMSRTEVWRALHGAAFFKGDTRQDLHRGQRRHLRRQRRCAALGHGLSHEPDRRRAVGAAPRPGPRAQARARPGRGLDAADGRDHEGRHAAAGAAEAGIHGAGQGDLDRARLRATAAAAALVRLFARRLAAAMGRGRQAGGARPLSRERPDQRQAEAQGSQTGNQIPARQRRLERQGLNEWPGRKNCRSPIFRKIIAGRTVC